MAVSRFHPLTECLDLPTVMRRVMPCLPERVCLSRFRSPLRPQESAVPIVLDRRLVALLIALGCAYLVSPVLAGLLAAVIVVAVVPMRLQLD